MKSWLAVRPIDLLLFLTVVTIWAFNFTVAKWGVAELPPMLFIGLRFFIVALVLLPFAPLPRGHWRDLGLASFTMGLLHFSCMFTAIKIVPAGFASLLGQAQVPIAAALSALILKDPPGWRRLTGMIISILGVAIVIGEPNYDGPWWGPVLVILAGLWWALANVQIKRLTQLSALTVNAWIAALAFPQLIIASLFVESGHWAALSNATLWGWGALLYNALAVVVLGYSIWYPLLKRYDVNQAMPFTLLIAPLAVLFATLFLGETLSWELIIGGLVTLVGVAIITLRRPQHVSGTERV